MPVNLDKIKESFTTGKARIKESFTKIKEKYNISMSSPNIRASVIGITAFLALVAVIIIISVSVSGGSSIDTFVKTEWANALEKADQKSYEKLWDKSACEKNKEHYAKAIELIGKKLKVDRSKIKPVRDFRNEDRYYIREIPVTLTDDGVEFLTYRDLKVEKKGWSGKWKIFDDDVYFLEDELPSLTENSDNDDDDSLPALDDSWIEDDDEIDTTKDTEDLSEGQDREIYPADTLDLISGNAPLDTKLKISQVIGEWQVAWQEKNIDKYMSQYADDAIITRVTINSGKEFPMKLTKSELRKRMETMNKRYQTIEVNISNLQIEGNRAIADVSFRQEFIGAPKGNLPIYSDIGTKTLTFMIDPSDGYWKIYEESWKLYVKVPRYPKL